ncbi:hypothetical protein F8388_020252 [Cannabis sativa]|uniref:Uncharacterized protein n=1 Tax=Cannabis sativa TaxID=3483 RepID=A0A7J6FVF4_CANSA|nr:hypothetical protein F8388_020252 [Cannabis sativa]
MPGLSDKQLQQIPLTTSYKYGSDCFVQDCGIFNKSKKINQSQHQPSLSQQQQLQPPPPPQPPQENVPPPPPPKIQEEESKGNYFEFNFDTIEFIDFSAEGNFCEIEWVNTFLELDDELHQLPS